MSVAIDDGETRVLLMSAELLELNEKQSLEIRQVISDFCNVPTDAIFLSCTHTHTGPVIGSNTQGEGNPEYEKFMVSQMRDAAYYALIDAAHKLDIDAAMRSGSLTVDPGSKRIFGGGR